MAKRRASLAVRPNTGVDALGRLDADTLQQSLADTEKYLVSEREKRGSLVKKLGLEGSQ